MRANRVFLIVLGVLAAGACGGREDPEGQATVAASDAVTPPASSDVQRAADIANALSAAPSKGDSILVAHKITAEALEQMMYRIARDSAMSAEYGRLTAR